MMSVLIIDDDGPMRDFIRRNLEARQFDVHEAANGIEGLAQVRHVAPDVVILDIMMPHLDGYETCKRVRQFSDVPVIVLTAMGDERDIVHALDCGADDCLTKPFGIEELLARLRSVLRRAKRDPTQPGEVIEFEELRIDVEANRVWLRDEELSLTRTEFSVLRYYAQNMNKTVPHELVLDAVWGPGYTHETHYIRIYVSRLRHKIERKDGPSYFSTERGLGYRFGR